MCTQRVDIEELYQELLWSPPYHSKKGNTLRGRQELPPVASAMTVRVKTEMQRTVLLFLPLATSRAICGGEMWSGQSRRALT